VTSRASISKATLNSPTRTPDGNAIAILQRLHASRELRRGRRVLLFAMDDEMESVTVCDARSSDHAVRISARRLREYLREFETPITEALVIQTLCDLYERPRHYGIRAGSKA
jgi:hypothetical protein